MKYNSLLFDVPAMTRSITCITPYQLHCSTTTQTHPTTKTNAKVQRHDHTQQVNHRTRRGVGERVQTVEPEPRDADLSRLRNVVDAKDAKRRRCDQPVHRHRPRGRADGFHAGQQRPALEDLTRRGAERVSPGDEDRSRPQLILPRVGLSEPPERRGQPTVPTAGAGAPSRTPDPAERLQRAVCEQEAVRSRPPTRLGPTLFLTRPSCCSCRREDKPSAT